jgi:hypothetical protein
MATAKRVRLSRHQFELIASAPPTSPACAIGKVIDLLSLLDAERTQLQAEDAVAKS